MQGEEFVAPGDRLNLGPKEEDDLDGTQVGGL